MLSEWGLTLSVVKTKLLVVGSEDESNLSLPTKRMACGPNVSTPLSLLLE